MSSISSLRKLASDSLVYGASGIISRFLSVFLVPIYTRIFEPSDYGVISLVTSVFSLLNILIIFGLDNSIARWYYDTDDDSDRKISLNTFLWSCTLFACLTSVFLFAFDDFIANKILKEQRAATILLIAAVNLPLTIFTTFTWNLLRMQRRAMATTVFTLATSLITIGLTLLFVVALRWGISGIFYAQVLTSIVALVWTLVLFHRQIALPQINLQRWREMVRFSLPLVPGSVAFWVVNLSGAYFIQLMNSSHEVGLYQIGVTIASAMAMITGAFQMAWGPFAYSIHKQPNANQVYAQTLLGYLALTCTVSLLITVFSREILLIFTTPQYVDSFWVAGILSYNFVIIGLSYIASIGTGLAKNNNTFGISMIVSAAILVMLNLVLVPIYGKEGAAISTLASQIIVPIAVFWHAQKLYPIPYNFSKAIFIFCSSFVIGFGELLMLTQMTFSFVTNIALKFFAVLLYCFLMLLIFRKEIWQAKAMFLDSLITKRIDTII